MSRTKKGKKGPGHEYWGKRPLRAAHPGGGTKNKRVAIQRERAIGKRSVAKETVEGHFHEAEIELALYEGALRDILSVEEDINAYYDPAAAALGQVKDIAKKALKKGKKK